MLAVPARCNTVVVVTVLTFAAASLASKDFPLRVVGKLGVNYLWNANMQCVKTGSASSSHAGPLPLRHGYSVHRLWPVAGLPVFKSGKAVISAKAVLHSQEFRILGGCISGDGRVLRNENRCKHAATARYSRAEEAPEGDADDGGAAAEAPAGDDSDDGDGGASPGAPAGDDSDADDAGSPADAPTDPTRADEEAAFKPGLASHHILFVPDSFHASQTDALKADAGKLICTAALQAATRRMMSITTEAEITTGCKLVDHRILAVSVFSDGLMTPEPEEEDVVVDVAGKVESKVHERLSTTLVRLTGKGTKAKIPFTNSQDGTRLGLGELFISPRAWNSIYEPTKAASSVDATEASVVEEAENSIRFASEAQDRARARQPLKDRSYFSTGCEFFSRNEKVPSLNLDEALAPSVFANWVDSTGAAPWDMLEVSEKSINSIVAADEARAGAKGTRTGPGRPTKRSRQQAPLAPGKAM